MIPEPIKNLPRAFIPQLLLTISGNRCDFSTALIGLKAIPREKCISPPRLRSCTGGQAKNYILGQVGKSRLEAFAGRISCAGASARIGQIGIHERQAIVQHQTIAPADHAEEANEFGGGLGVWHHVGGVGRGLDALHNGGGETTQGAFWIILLFEWTLDRVGEEESLALEL